MIRVNWKQEWPHWLILAAMFGLAAVAWGTAPDRIPVHWNVAGEVDRYGGKVEGLLGIPLVSAGLYLLLVLLPRLDPRRESFERFAGVYVAVRLSILVVMLGVYLLIHAAMRGVQVPVPTVVCLLLGVLFVVLGWSMPRLHPNWTIGIRTPWTLSSDDVWRRTHQAGGPVLITTGLLTAVAGLLPGSLALPVVIAGMIASMLGLVVYSYWLWRSQAASSDT